MGEPLTPRKQRRLNNKVAWWVKQGADPAHLTAEFRRMLEAGPVDPDELSTVLRRHADELAEKRLREYAALLQRRGLVDPDAAAPAAPEPIDLDALAGTPQTPAAQPDPHGRTAP